jgi:GMP synthase-like glutamine amidotransferase
MPNPLLRVHYFQHIHHEGYGSPEAYLRQLGAVITHTAFHDLAKGEQASNLPSIDDIDFLIIMGGSMSVNDEAIYPWLIQEKAWIKAFIEQDKPVVGLCLGGQLIASSFGAVVQKNAVQELGWWPVYAAPVDRAQEQHAIFEFPEKIDILSWHGETFELPDGAVLLAANEACPRQAYQYKHNVIGFQCHPESTPHALSLYLEDKDEITEYTGQFVQTASQLHQTTAAQFLPANQLLNDVIDFVLMATHQKR